MFLIQCPYCGDCDASEFSYHGDASQTMPELNGQFDDWFDYTYLRTNPRGLHTGYWQHVHGCRQWIRVERDTLSHEVNKVSLP